MLQPRYLYLRLLFLVALCLQATATPLHAGQPAAAGDPPITWGSVLDVTGSGRKAIFPSAAVDRLGTTHVVYSTADAVDNDLWYTNNRAGAWAAPQRIERGIGTARDPFYGLAIGPDGLTLHLVYAWAGGAQRVYYRAGTPSGSGVAWSPRETISDDLSAKAYDATLAVGPGGDVHIAWIDNRCGDYTVRYRMRAAGGSLGAPLAPEGGCVYMNRPSLAVTRDGRVHLVYARDAEITYARLEVAGWVRQNLSQSATNSYNPALTTDGTGLYVAWDEGINEHDILFRRSRDAGATWSTTISFSGTPQFASFPHAAYLPAAGRVVVAWADATGNSNGETTIWYRTFDPFSGQTSTGLRLSPGSGPTTLPMLAAWEQRIVASWQDRSPGFWRIQVVNGTGHCSSQASALPAGGKAQPEPLAGARVNYLPLVVNRCGW